MYLKQIFLKNCGPIEKCAFELPFDADNKPKPLILVGENGSGKSILLSYIVDALHEFFIQCNYKNLVGSQEATNVSLGHSMYKISGTFNKKIGSPNALSSLIFNCQNGEHCGYLSFQDISIEDAKKEVGEEFPTLTYPPLHDIEANKAVSEKKELYNNEYQKGCFVFFPDYRQEEPIWVNSELVHIRPELINDKTQKPLIVSSSQNENTSWLLDILWDFSQNNNDAKLFFENINEILCKILKRSDVFIGNDSRKYGGVNRITIGVKEKEDRRPLCPRINALSEGQSTLLNIFLTILRYADLGDCPYIEHLTGIVIIDEIENHLHDDIIANVLPDLIKMFPKIQFIITSHSPMFLLGMNKVFGENGFQIREMPTGLIIEPEDYSQFQVMFDIISQTEKIKKLMDSTNKEKELIITEGQTDWMHMKKAFEKLELEAVQFLEYEDSMGDSTLANICQSCSKIPHDKPIICIFDSDNTTYLNKHNTEKEGIKAWGNNVYSFCIPVPDFRICDKYISIEMYYPDEILKTITTIGGKEKCLYFENELCYEKDNYHILDKPCSNGDRKIKDKDVDNFKNPYNKPFIKTKKEFAGEIRDEKINGVDYTPFNLIYDKIKEILQQQE